MQEPCSFPLVVESESFGTDSHTVVVTVTNGTGGSQELSFDFRLENREIYIYIVSSSFLSVFPHC